MTFDLDIIGTKLNLRSYISISYVKKSDRFNPLFQKNHFCEKFQWKKNWKSFLKNRKKSLINFLKSLGQIAHLAAFGFRDALGVSPLFCPVIIFAVFLSLFFFVIQKKVCVCKRWVNELLLRCFDYIKPWRRNTTWLVNGATTFFLTPTLTSDKKKPIGFTPIVKPDFRKIKPGWPETDKLKKAKTQLEIGWFYLWFENDVKWYKRRRFSIIFSENLTQNQALVIWTNNKVNDCKTR